MFWKNKARKRKLDRALAEAKAANSSRAQRESRQTADSIEPLVIDGAFTHVNPLAAVPYSFDQSQVADERSSGQDDCKQPEPAREESYQSSPSGSTDTLYESTPSYDSSSSSSYDSGSSSSSSSDSGSSSSGCD